MCSGAAPRRQRKTPGAAVAEKLGYMCKYTHACVQDTCVHTKPTLIGYTSIRISIYVVRALVSRKGEKMRRERKPNESIQQYLIFPRRFSHYSTFLCVWALLLFFFLILAFTNPEVFLLLHIREQGRVFNRKNTYGP